MKGKIKRRVAALAVAATVLLAFTACNDSAAKEEYFEVFGTTLCITTANAEEAERAALEMQNTELAVSAAIADSDIGRINAAAAGESVVVGDITMQLLQKAYRAYELTDGAYDPTVAPLVELWGFAAGDFVQRPKSCLPRKKSRQNAARSGLTARSGWTPKTTVWKSS